MLLLPNQFVRRYLSSNIDSVHFIFTTNMEQYSFTIESELLSPPSRDINNEFVDVSPFFGMPQVLFYFQITIKRAAAQALGIPCSTFRFDQKFKNLTRKAKDGEKHHLEDRGLTDL